MFRLVFVYFLSHIIVYCSAGVVTFIKPCKSDDKACLLTSAQAAMPFIVDGLPDLSMPALDPLVLNDVRADDGDVKLGLKDLTIVGLRNCKFQSIEFSSEMSLAFDMECPILATGKYSVGGKLLGVHIKGNGDLVIKTDKIKLIVKVELKRVKGADGKEYFNIISAEKSYELVNKFDIQLKNLFNGDEKKAKPIVEILNISWKELILSIGKPIINQLIDKAEHIVNQFFVAVPANELVL